MKALPRLLRLGAAALTAFALTSCFEVEQKVVLNPDGSGKLVMSTAMGSRGGLGGLVDRFGGGDGDKKPGKDGKGGAMKAQARELAVSMLRSEGIEAWSDVRYEVNKEGKAFATVTGYFPDVGKVKVSEGPLQSADKGDKGEKKKKGGSALDITKDGEGNWVLDLTEELSEAKKKADEPKKDGGEAPKLTDAELEDKIAEERQKWGFMKGMMESMLGGMRVKFQLEGGGSVTVAEGFTKAADNAASFEFDGKKMMKGLDEVMKDDEKLKAMVKSGKSPLDDSAGGEAFLSGMGGPNGKVRVVMKPGTPAFDYKAEVEKAKASVSPELTALLADAANPANPSHLLHIPGLTDGGKDDDSKPEAPRKKKKPAKAERID